VAVVAVAMAVAVSILALCAVASPIRCQLGWGWRGRGFAASRRRVWCLGGRAPLPLPPPWREPLPVLILYNMEREEPDNPNNLEYLLNTADQAEGLLVPAHAASASGLLNMDLGGNQGMGPAFGAGAIMDSLVSTLARFRLGQPPNRLAMRRRHTPATWRCLMEVESVMNWQARRVTVTVACTRTMHKWWYSTTQVLGNHTTPQGTKVSNK